MSDIDPLFFWSVSPVRNVMRPLTCETPPVSCKAKKKVDNLRAPSSSANQWAVLKQRSKDNVPTDPTMGSTPIFQPSPAGHIKLWISSLPKASGGFSHASRASMGIVFLPPQWPNQLWGHFLLLSCPFYSRPCSDLAGAAQGRDGREKAHAFTSASHAHKERNQIAQTCTHAHMHVWAHACSLTDTHTPHLIQRGITMRMCERR